MDTTITISSKSVTNKSDFLHLTYNTGKNKDAIISVDSSNFGQSGSVTWDKKCSPISNIEKVTNWMKQSDNECVKNEFIDSVKNNESEAKSLILVRCDFNKASNTQSYYPSPFNRSTSLINYFKDETLAKHSKVPMTPKLEGTFKAPEKKSNCFHLEKEVAYSPLSKTDSSYSNDMMDEVPLSPESRKKELCHYLQLMNPADKKEIIILQNRRSTRVRHLAEQKQVQEKLKEITEVVNKETTIEIPEKTATLKSFKELNIQIDTHENVDDDDDDGVDDDESDKMDHFAFPFPPKNLITATKDFDAIMTRLVPRLKRRLRDMKIPLLTTNKPKGKKYASKPIDVKNKISKMVKTVPKMGRNHVKQRIKTLRSNGSLKDIPIKKLIAKNEKHIIKTKTSKSTHEKLNSRQSITPVSHKSRTKSPAKSIGSNCEIISVGNTQDDEFDLDHFMDDMVDFDKLSDEHRKCLIESRILSTHKTISHPYNMDMSPLFGFSKSDAHEISKMCEKYKNSLQLKLQKDALTDIKVSKDVEMEKDNGNVEKEKDKQTIGGNTYLIVNIHTPDSSENVSGSSAVSEQSTSSTLREHDYASVLCKNSDKEDSDIEETDTRSVQAKEANSGHFIEVNTNSISNNTKFELLPFKPNGGTKSLHKSLQFNGKKTHTLTSSSALTHEWDMPTSPKLQLKKQSHFISISSENGAVLKAFYVSYNLIICQEFLISFWMQTPLGNVLGSQNMWVPRGQTQRIVLNNRCLQKDSMEKIICSDTSIVYIELWMKEHKSEMRQGPVADVFVTLYYWKQRQNGLDKKVLQLENINGFADDVQYCVLKNFPKIIVSWHSANEETTQPKRTFIHAYQLAPDYQTVSNIYDIEPVDHYVSSLHNIEDYDDLIMGCGENKITLWNIEFGHVIATVELNDIKTPLSTLWVKCDRGFLFALQQCVDRELRLIAINGMKQSWKKLASYFPPEGFDRLKGVCIENGLLISFYDQGILCWNTETGEPVEEISLDNDIILSGTHVILVEDNQIIVKHALAHLMSMSVEES